MNFFHSEHSTEGDRQVGEFSFSVDTGGHHTTASAQVSSGGSIGKETVDAALQQMLSSDESGSSHPPSSGGTDHTVTSETNSDEAIAHQSQPNFDSRSTSSGQSFQIDSDQLSTPQSLNSSEVGQASNLEDRLGANGDFLDPGGGTNTVIGAGGNDIIRGDTPGAFNTITTGTGRDLVVLGSETTNRVFDFDTDADQFGLNDIPVDHIQIGQGTNPQTGGLDQPLDSRNNTVISDRTSSRVLASLPFVDSSRLNSNHFVTVNSSDLEQLSQDLATQSSG